MVKNMNKPPMNRLIMLTGSSGLLRPRDLASRGIARTYLGLAVKRGTLTQVGRGLYAVPDAPVVQNAALAEVCKRVPHGVICLLSALRFHEIGTQNPSDVWLAVRHQDHKPAFIYPRIRLVRFSERSMADGIEKHNIGGVIVRITNPGKTIADCFKYRNKIGLDVAIEALRECVRQRRCTPDELWKHGEVCRVANVMRPYLEAML
jgi:predicted transcriptional regulator of viral defense system